MTFILYLIFGLSPSIIWLLFYLKKDPHPESRRMIAKVFLLGILAALAAGVVELGLFKLAENAGIMIRFSDSFPLLYFLFYNFILVSFVEEYSKYIMVRIGAVKDTQFDEPVDVVIYMITAALGFAALENLLYIVPVLFPEENFTIFQAGTISLFRFIGATFLHALGSGIAGIFLAISFYKKKRGYAFLGIFLAVLLHGLFNISIIGIEGGMAKKDSFLVNISLVSLSAILFFIAMSVSAGFKKLKKLASVCKI